MKSTVIGLGLVALLGIVAGGCGDGELGEDAPLYDGESPGELVEVPGGPFVMGGFRDVLADWNQDRPDEGFADELPQRLVDLSPYFIQRTEVTNAQYRLCVLEGACREPAALDSVSREFYFSDPAYGAFPAIGLTWSDAATYCQWAGMRLPTEAEWEKAARGADGPRRFPWGEEDGTCERANLGIRMTTEDGGMVNGCVGDTTPVGFYAQGVSPCGALDLCGNVAEWVADRYAADYYDTALYPDNLANPRGPTEGARRVVRGGSFAGAPYLARTGYRSSMHPDASSPDVGFRCARN